MESLLKDLRFAAKLLMKQKGFTGAALLTLALCIGANTAMFSVLDSVLLRPLPFSGAERYVRMFNMYPKAGADRGSNGVPDYYDRLEQTTAFEHIAMLRPRGMTVGEAGRPERITGMAVTPSLFAMLGVTPVAGRTFTEQEGERGNDQQAILSYGLWQEQYGGRRKAVGATIRIDDVPHTIVGVMPRNFEFEDPEARLWVPLTFNAEQRGDDNRHNNNYDMIALRRPGVTLEQAQAQIDALNAANDKRFPAFSELLRKAGFRTMVVDYRADLTRDVRDTLWLLQGGVLLVLLIGCVNIANLILVRSTSRHRELATRAALGAAHGRLVRQLLTESVLLALVGGALGVAVGYGGIQLVTGLAGDALPRASEIGIDLRTLLSAFAASLAAGLVFGAIPVVRLMRGNLSGVFREEGRTGTAARGTHLWRGALVVTQVSLAFALLVGAGLLVASFARAMNVNPGFDADNVLTAAFSMPVTRYPEDADRRLLMESVLEAARRVPGVTYAGVVDGQLFGDEYNSSVVTAEGYIAGPEESLISPYNSRVSDGYFEAMQIDVTAGRAFTAADRVDSPPVAIIDRMLAEKFWPGQDPIGRRITQGVPDIGRDEDMQWRTIVGVAENVRVSALTGEETLGHMYVPASQNQPGRLFLSIRTATDPASVTNALRSAITSLDAEMPLYQIRTMEERVAASMAPDRMRMVLLVSFAALALFLAAVGLYGVLAYSVAQRSAEIGIRMALGSSARDVFRMVLSQGARLMTIGLGLGIAASLALANVVRSMLYGVEPTDPAVYGLVLILLSVTAAVACLVPARRAMRVDPLAAIRDT